MTTHEGEVIRVGVMLLGELDILLRLFVSFLIGIVMGFERSRSHKAAGMRTHSIVSVTSTMITIIARYGVSTFEQGALDPTRLIVGIVTGVGFIGAGMIWKDSTGGINGLTTAANIWAAAGLGISIGLGHYFLTFVTLGFVLISLYVLKAIQRRTDARHAALLEKEAAASGIGRENEESDAEANE